MSKKRKNQSAPKKTTPPVANANEQKSRENATPGEPHDSVANPLSRNLPRRLTLLLPAIIALLVFSLTLSNGFVFDDHWIVECNPLIKSLSQTPQIFHTTYWHAANRNRGLYRPLTILSYALNQTITGADAWGYHAVNALLHAGVTLLLTLTALMLGFSRKSALAIGLLFAVHPIHTEAVCTIVGRAELLAAACCLGMLAIGVHYFNNAKKNTGAAWQLPAIMGLLFFTGLLCKEITVTFLAFPLLYGWSFPATTATEQRRLWQRIGLTLAVLAAVLGGYLLIRARVVGVFTPPDIAFLDNPLKALPLGSRFLGTVMIFGEYLRLCLFPLRLASDYGYHALPLGSPLKSFCFWLGIAGSFSLLFAVYQGLCAKIKSSRQTAFFLLQFFAVYALISNVLIVIGTPMAERLFYLPSALLCLAAAPLLDRTAAFCQTRNLQRVGTVLFLAVIAILTIRTFVRIRDWRDDATLYAADARSQPHSVKLRLNYANVLINQKAYKQAEEQLQVAAKLYPQCSDVWLERARVQEGLKNTQQQRALLEKAHRLSPRNVQVCLALGRLNLRQRRFPEAIQAFSSALELDPHLELAKYYLGQACFFAGKMKRCSDILSAPLRLAPRQMIQRFLLLGQALERQRQMEKAAQVYREGVQKYPHSAGLLERLGLLEYSVLHDYTNAQQHFTRLLQLRPKHPQRAQFLRALRFLKTHPNKSTVP